MSKISTFLFLNKLRNILGPVVWAYEVHLNAPWSSCQFLCVLLNGVMSISEIVRWTLVHQEVEAVRRRERTQDTKEC